MFRPEEIRLRADARPYDRVEFVDGDSGAPWQVVAHGLGGQANRKAAALTRPSTDYVHCATVQFREGPHQR